MELFWQSPRLHDLHRLIGFQRAIEPPEPLHIGCICLRRRHTAHRGRHGGAGEKERRLMIGKGNSRLVYRDKTAFRRSFRLAHPALKREVKIEHGGLFHRALKARE